MQKRAAENICITSTALYWSENLFLFLSILFFLPLVRGPIFLLCNIIQCIIK